jgi:hypothetical protein
MNYPDFKKFSLYDETISTTSTTTSSQVKEMTDITKCSGANCDLKLTCYRYTASEGMYQSYFMNPPIKDEKCEYHWNTKANEK